MQDRIVPRLLTALAGTFVLLVLFVAYRARTFHYCVGYEERDQGRVVSSTEPCRADEKPMGWKSQGWHSKLKLAGSTTAKALGAN
jgi:hypothetical protein